MKRRWPMPANHEPEPFDPITDELNALCSEFEIPQRAEVRNVSQAELRAIEILEQKLASARSLVGLIIKQRAARVSNIRLRLAQGGEIDPGPLGIKLGDHYGNSR